MLDITPNERTMLLGLALHPDREHTPAQLIEAMPVAFGNRSVQGIHQTGASLVHKNLVYRCNVGGDRVGYQIRPEVLPELDTRPADTETRLIAAAIQVAADAPARRGTYVSSALVPWSDIELLRDALDAAGIDWRKIKNAREGR
jgi:hypothetical protein